MYSAFSHGKYGKEHITGFVCSTINKEMAIEMATELVSQMSYRDLKRNHYGDTVFVYKDGKSHQVSADDAVGLEYAIDYFTYKARLFRG